MIQPPDHVPAAPRVEADPRLEGQIEARREELERQIDDRIAELQREVEALNGALDAAGEAVQLCITMIGVMGLWVGLMEIASKSVKHEIEKA